MWSQRPPPCPRIPIAWLHDSGDNYLDARRLGDGRLPADNNGIENRIRPISLGRANWRFAGSLRAGQRAAAIMSLIGSAKMNDLDPYAYFSEVLARLPTHPARRVAELLRHRWHPANTH